MAAANSAAGGGDTMAAFARIYDVLKEELLKDPAFDFTHESHQWVDRVMLLPSFPHLLFPCLIDPAGLAARTLRSRFYSLAAGDLLVLDLILWIY